MPGNRVHPKISIYRGSTADEGELDESIGSHIESSMKIETSDEKKGWIGRCVWFLKSRGYWQSVKTIIIFHLHFLAVMLVLFGGAVIFAYLEDKEFISNSAKNTSIHLSDQELFWNNIEHKFNLSVRVDLREMLIQQFRNFSAEVEKREKDRAYKELHNDKMFVFRKWLYFGTVVATTIGYGDVTPKTEEGRLFYIFFSIIVISLMITLLKRCGTVISAANRKVYDLVSRYFCRKGKELISREVLSTISIILIFICYLFSGIMYGKNESERVDWSLTANVYYWIVTFTTVGFGDLTRPLAEEVDNLPGYIVYRVFGLTILAAIIDALQQCVKTEQIGAKKEKFKEKLMVLKNEAIARSPRPIAKFMTSEKY